MKSLKGKFPSTRGWALLLILLLGAGLLVAGCGEEEVPAPTTPTPPPAPPPAPEPEPEPEPPAKPTGLMVSASTASSITWTWNAVEGAIGYVVQASMDEMFDDMVLGNPETVLFDGAPFTTMTTYTASDLEAGATVYVRVAAAGGTAAAPLVSDFSTHVTGMAMVAAGSAPANLQVKERGSDFIEWAWDAVDGVDGYQSEFSTDSAFSAPNAEFHTADQRTRRVSNLDPNSDGYLRVRTLVGTLSDGTFGEWGAASMGSTGAAAPPPPSAVALDPPENVRTSSPTETSIAVQWDAVEEADSYFVQQSEAGGDWEGARCGVNGDSEVTVTACVASGLSRATDYRFRVRAMEDGDIPDSDWSAPTATLRTSGTAPPPPVMSDDALNVKWTSGADSITWDWDPSANRDDRERIDHWAFVTNAMVTECPAVSDPPAANTSLTSGAWANLKRNISATLDTTRESGLTRGMVRTLCVVRTWEDDLGGGLKVRKFGTPAVVMAATSPDVGRDADGTTETTPNPAFSENDDKQETTRIEWVFMVDRGFRYPGQLVSMSRDDALPTGANMCDGKSVSSPGASGRDNVPIRHRKTITPTNAYRRYRFCVRAENDHGWSDWQPIGVDDVEALPGKPGNPSYDSTDSEIRTHSSGSHIVQKLAWSVAIAETTPAPQRATNYDSIILISKKSNGTVAICDTTGRPDDFTAITSPTSAEVDSLGGIAITLTAAAAGDGDEDLLDGVDDLDLRYYYACVKAMPSTARVAAKAGGSSVTDEGPWVIGRSAGFRRNVGTPSLTVSQGANSGEITITVGSVNGAASYQLQQRDSDTDDATPGNQAGDWSDVTVPTDRIVTVSGVTAGDRQDFQVRAVTTVRGDTVNGKYSGVRSTVPRP